MGAALEIVGTGSSTLQLGSRKRQPDRGIRPRHFAKDWPALVIKAGYSESRAKVDADASAWRPASEDESCNQQKPETEWLSGSLSIG